MTCKLAIFNRFLLLAILAFSGSVLGYKPNGIIRYPQEIHLANVVQLTFGGQNAEAYFSFDNKQITFQATNFGSHCDQIYRFSLSDVDMSSKPPPLVSTGNGTTTCSYFLSNNQHIIYASTHLGNAKCISKPCANNTVNNPYVQELCNNHTYLWTVDKNYDVFKAEANGEIIQRMSTTVGYDAEATVSPAGDKIVFTSVRSGDLELWLMDVNGSNLIQVTNVTGYDGGAFFSPDGSQLVFRASRPSPGSETVKYQLLLEEGLVSPTEMELFTVKIDGSDLKQITRLGGANWAPFYHPRGHKIIFSSNYNSKGFNFNLFTVAPDGTSLEQITFDPKFDAFPMFSFDGKKVIFGSMRNQSSDDEINLFIADWIDKPSTTQTSTTAAAIALKINKLGWMNHHIGPTAPT